MFAGDQHIGESTVTAFLQQPGHEFPGQIHIAGGNQRLAVRPQQFENLQHVRAGVTELHFRFKFDFHPPGGIDSGPSGDLFINVVDRNFTVSVSGKCDFTSLPLRIDTNRLKTGKLQLFANQVEHIRRSGERPQNQRIKNIE